MKNLFITASLALALIFGAANSQESKKGSVAPIKKTTTTETKTTTTTTESIKPTTIKPTTTKTTTTKTSKTPVTKTAKAVKPVKGTIVSITSIATGGNGIISKDAAEKLIANGDPLAFKVGKKIYFVYNADGSYAGKKIAKFAHNKMVGIIGKTKTVGGVNVIVMDDIKPMD